MDWSSQPVGGFAEVMPNLPPYFLIASHRQFCLKYKSGRSQWQKFGSWLREKVKKILVAELKGRER